MCVCVFFLCVCVCVSLCDEPCVLSQRLGLFIRCAGRSGNFIVLISPDRLLPCTLTARRLPYLYAASKKDLRGANCLAQIETAIASLKWVCACVRTYRPPLHLPRPSRCALRTFKTKGGEELKSACGYFIYWWPSWCCASSVNKCWGFMVLVLCCRPADAHLSRFFFLLFFLPCLHLLSTEASRPTPCSSSSRISSSATPRGPQSYLTPWLLSLAAAAEDKTAIHHGPLAEVVTDKSRQNQWGPCTRPHSCAFAPWFCIFGLLFFLRFLPLPVFIYLNLTTALVNIISACPCAPPKVNTLMHRGAVSLDMRLKKGSAHWGMAASYGLPKAMRLVSAAPPTSRRCIVNFFGRTRAPEVGKCCHSTHYKW